MRPSTPSSRSVSPEPQETVQIFIKPLSGETFPITVPTDTSISTLLTLLSLRTSLPPPSLRLVHAGKHLSTPSSTLRELSLSPSSVLHLATPLRGGMPPKKQRCTYKECKDAAQRIIGDCGFCEGNFCGKHRLLEDHKCEGLEDCKKESHERNKEQLERERTLVVKGI